MVLCYCVVIIDWTVVLATHASNRHQGGCLPAAIDTETYHHIGLIIQQLS